MEVSFTLLGAHAWERGRFLRLWGETCGAVQQAPTSQRALVAATTSASKAFYRQPPEQGGS